MEVTLLSKREREKYVHEGFSYTFDKLSSCEEKKFWRCSFKSDGCKARLHTCVFTGQVVSTLNQHSHGADPGFIESEKTKNAIKRRAVQVTETPDQLISTVLAGTSTAVQGQLPSKSALRKIVQRKRISVKAVPPSPANLESLVIPDSYKYYVASKDETILFLLGDSGSDENRILLFGREDAEHWSAMMKTIYMDGTFKIAPPLFSQVFAILVERDGFVFPVLYALLPNKRQETYCTLFRLIKTVWPNFEPESISTDYEMAIINAVTETFPAVEIHGCLFHLAQNIFKKLGRDHLLAEYNGDADFALQVCMIVALEFVPLDHLDEAVRRLYDHLPANLQTVLEWFEVYTPSLWYYKKLLFLETYVIPRKNRTSFSSEVSLSGVPLSQDTETLIVEENSEEANYYENIEYVEDVYDPELDEIIQAQENLRESSSAVQVLDTRNTSLHRPRRSSPSPSQQRSRSSSLSSVTANNQQEDVFPRPSTSVQSGSSTSGVCTSARRKKKILVYTTATNFQPS